MAFTRPFDAVLFDLDGTLLDSAPEIVASVNAALRALGLPVAEEALVSSFIGYGVRRTLGQAYDHVSPGIESTKREADLDRAMLTFGEHYGRIAPNSQLFPDTVSTLTALHNAGVKCAIVSNKEAHFVSQLLSGGPLPALIDLTISGDTLSRRKPDPLPVTHTLDVFGIGRDRALFVGDSHVDVACARAAGVQVWLVPYGYNGGRPASEAGADRVIESLSDVARACIAPARQAAAC